MEVLPENEVDVAYRGGQLEVLGFDREILHRCDRGNSVGKGPNEIARGRVVKGGYRHVKDSTSDRYGVSVELEHDSRDDTVNVVNESKQNVLSVGVGVTLRFRLARSGFEHGLQSRSQRRLPARLLEAGSDRASNLHPHFVDGEVEGTENLSRNTLPLAQEAK